MISNSRQKLIELTKKEFQACYEPELTDIEACEIINNFTGFARLLITIDKRRQELRKIEQDEKE